MQATLEGIQRILKASELRLNEAAERIKTDNPIAEEVNECLLYMAIFLNETGSILGGISINRTVGFAKKNALAQLSHKIYEYNEVFNKVLKTKLSEIAKERNIAFDAKAIKSISRDFPILRKIEKLKDRRNIAGGHYDKNYKKLHQHIDDINEKELIGIYEAIINFNKRIIRSLLDSPLKETS